MPEQLGKLITCRRCGNSIFLKQTGEVGLSNYAGPGTRATYEDLPKTWLDPWGIGHLCPVCAKEIIDFMIKFLGKDEYDKMPAAWKIEEE